VIRLPRVLSLVLAQVLLVGLAAGCVEQVNHSQGPLAIRIVDGELEVAVCADVDAAGLSVEVRSNGEWLTAWKAQGEAAISRSDVLDADSLAALFTSVDVQTVDFLGSRDMSIVIDAQRASNNIVSAFESALLDSDGSLWLHPDDSLSQSACAT
jgi:hypothetical protein